MRIIAISGKSGSGKDTIADYMINKNKYWVKIGIADNLKRTCMKLFGFSFDQMFGSSECRNTPNKNGVLARTALVNVGNAMRQTYENIHTDLLIKDIRLLSSVKRENYTLSSSYFYSQQLGPHIPQHNIRHNTVVVTDARFKSDLTVLKSNNAFLIRIKNPRLDLTKLIYQDVSETEQDSIPDSFFDIVIDNDLSLDDLFLKVDNILANFHEE